jgi:hypothetical protein
MADGVVTPYTGKCEFGQGLITSQTQLVAEELGVPRCMPPPTRSLKRRRPAQNPSFDAMSRALFAQMARTSSDIRASSLPRSQN